MGTNKLPANTIVRQRRYVFVTFRRRLSAGEATAKTALLGQLAWRHGSRETLILIGRMVSPQCMRRMTESRPTTGK